MPLSPVLEARTTPFPLILGGQDSFVPSKIIVSLEPRVVPFVHARTWSFCRFGYSSLFRTIALLIQTKTISYLWFSRYKSYSALLTATQSRSNTMSAPTNTHASGANTQSGPANKRRREDNQAMGDDDESPDDEYEYDSSDGELEFEETQGRKRQKAAMRQEATEARHRNAMMAEIADAPNVPNAASQISQAIYECVRMLMGISRKSRSGQLEQNTVDPSLPLAPTVEEMNEWVNRQNDREEFIDSKIKKAMRAYIASKPQGFKPNRKQVRTVKRDAAERARNKHKLMPVKFLSRMDLSSSYKYSHSWGTKCEAALALAGFTRCTFDWRAGYDTPWNSTMSSIIIEQWLKCFNASGARSYSIISSDNTSGNREELLRRWFTNKKKQYGDQCKQNILMTTAEGREKLKIDKAHAKKVVKRRKAKAAIHKARLSVATEMFGESSSQVKMLTPREVHSEDELGSSGGSSKVRLAWRSAELDNFISLIDQTIVSREVIAAAKRSARHLTDRGPYSTTPDTDMFPPKRFQRSLISPTWMSSMSGVAIRHLDLQTEETIDITKSIEKLIENLASHQSTSS
ncbi:uncharacterized protein MELLADRAFT_95688 [Melampsora larici-populina 98AG31]|uniref:Uncharacterized protein n=1 Tax=Melampsora larici-populina (strain 98AG31 / pathotype 3-4-7) TaxID=747676 RepID=F4SA90_MELLP|nr:uncharacterized protein MELLADRAFT_95688 [Melampsora larici-populina 98AG31]EGF98409.1 hypothetical protein MELLADRAFT_95688 [Melampsora larici-populina 98AG31]